MLFHSPPKAHCQKSISVTILTSTAWRTLGLLGAFPARARGGEGALSPSCRAPHGHDQISGRMFSLTFFHFFDLRPTKVEILQLAKVDSCKWQKHCRKSGCIRLARGWSPFAAERPWGGTIDWFWLRGWLTWIDKAAICTGTAPSFWNCISFLGRPPTANKISMKNQKSTSVYSPGVAFFGS